VLKSDYKMSNSTFSVSDLKKLYLQIKERLVEF